MIFLISFESFDFDSERVVFLDGMPVVIDQDHLLLAPDASLQMLQVFNDHTVLFPAGISVEPFFYEVFRIDYVEN